MVTIDISLIFSFFSILLIVQDSGGVKDLILKQK
jgi:hypothetical protein